MGIIRDTCSFFRSIFEGAKDLKPQERLEIYEAIFEYMFYDIEREQMKPTTRLAFMSNKMAFDNAKNRYDTMVKCGEFGVLGAEYGKLGGRPKKKTPSTTPQNPVGGFCETPQNPQEIDKDIYITTDRSNNYSLTNKENVDIGLRSNLGEALQVVLSACKTHCPKLYERHLTKPNGDYALGQLLMDFNYPMQEQLDDFFKHINKTYIIQPKYQNLDLCWVINNYEKAQAIVEEEVPTGGEQTKKRSMYDTLDEVINERINEVNGNN